MTMSKILLVQWMNNWAKNVDECPVGCNISKTSSMRHVLQKHSGEWGAQDSPGGIMISCFTVSGRLPTGRGSHSWPPPGCSLGVDWVEWSFPNFSRNQSFSDTMFMATPSGGFKCHWRGRDCLTLQVVCCKRHWTRIIDPSTLASLSFFQH